MKQPVQLRTGLPPLAVPPATGVVAVDGAVLELRRFVQAGFRMFGIMVSPGDNLRATLGLVDSGETIVLLPGEHFFDAGLTLTRTVRLVAHGRVRLRFRNAALTITAADVLLQGIEFARDVRTGSDPQIDVQGARCRIDLCQFSGPTARGILVQATGCAVTGCKFATDAAHVAGDADAYYADGITYGIVCGNAWSTTRQFVLSYQAAMNMSQAANGPGPPPGIVQERP